MSVLFDLPTDNEERVRLRRVIDGGVRYELAIVHKDGPPSSVDLTIDEVEAMLDSLELEMGDKISAQVENAKPHDGKGSSE